MVRGHQVGVGGYAQVGGVRSAGFEAVDLLEQGLRVDDHTVADHRGRIGAEDARGKELELELLTAHHHGVPGVVTAVGFDHVVHPAAQEIRGLALALIAPLGSDDHDCWHSWLLLPGLAPIRHDNG